MAKDEKREGPWCKSNCYWSRLGLAFAISSELMIRRQIAGRKVRNET
jgi:hypothetical protein